MVHLPAARILASCQGLTLCPPCPLGGTGRAPYQGPHGGRAGQVNTLPPPPPTSCPWPSTLLGEKPKGHGRLPHKGAPTAHCGHPCPFIFLARPPPLHLRSLGFPGEGAGQNYCPLLPGHRWKGGLLMAVPAEGTNSHAASGSSARPGLPLSSQQPPLASEWTT